MTALATPAPSPAARLGETWWLGLRLAEGLSESEACARAGVDVQDTASDAVRERARATVLDLQRQGWIEEHGERWKLSARGLPLADAIAREFLRLGEARGPRE